MADRDILVRLKLESAGTLPKDVKDVATSGAKASAETAKLSDATKRASSDARQAATAYDKLKQSATGAANAANAANVNRPGGVVAGVPSRPAAGAVPAGGAQPAAPGIAGALGLPPELFAAVASAIAVIKGFSTALSVTAKAIDAFKDSTLTAGQAQRKIAESIPLIGELAKSFNELSDAVSGRTRAIREATQSDVLTSAAQAADLQAYNQNLPLQQQLNDLRARAQLQTPERGGVPFVGFDAPARDTFQGEIAYQQYERRQPLEMDQRNKQIDLEAAQQAVNAARQEREARERDVKAREDIRKREGFDLAFMASDRTEGVFGGGSPSGAALDAYQRTKEAIAEEIKAREQLKTATQQEANAVQAALKAESDLRKANIALAKDKLAVMKEEAQQIASTAQAFGSLSALDKQAALEAAQAYSQKGYDQLTPEQKQALQGAGFGQQLAFAAQQSALNDPTFAAISALFGQSADLKGKQKAIAELQAQIALDVQLDEKQFANAIKETLEPLIKQIIESNEKIAALLIKKVEVGQGQANAGQ